MGFKIGVAAIESHDPEAIRAVVEALGFRMDPVEVLQGPDRLRIFAERFYDAGPLRRYMTIGLWRSENWTQLCSDRVAEALLHQTDLARLMQATRGARLFGAMISSAVGLCAFGVWNRDGLRRVIDPGDGGGGFLQEGARLPSEEWTTREDLSEEVPFEVASYMSLDLEADVATSDWLAIADISDKPRPLP